MATLAHRYRSSTSNSAPQTTTKATEILHRLLTELDDAVAVRSATAGGSYPDVPTLTTSIRKIHQHLASTAFEPPSPPQDDFRHLRGFQKVLDALRSYGGFYNPQTRTDADKASFFELLGAALEVLSAAFHGHPGNRRYFRTRVEGGGWEALEQVLASIGLGGSDADLWTNCHLFGKLLAFSLHDARIDQLFQALSGPEPDEKELIDGDGTTSSQGSLVVISRPDSVAADLRKIIGVKTRLDVPEILRTVVGFWESMERPGSAPASPCSLAVLETLSAVASTSLYNLSALHSTCVLSSFLHLAFRPDTALRVAEKAKVVNICKMLMYLGVNRPADTQFLLSTKTTEASEFCLEMTTQYSGPPFFQFDLSLHGHSSIELPTLGRSFPPQSSAGYTFTAWIRVDRFDPTAHTTIFGVFDVTQTCFLLMYLERDTQNFILQTSVTSQKPSVRFRTLAFKERQWYHVALVHRRPKAITTSKATLYINGEFVEQLRCPYPSAPPFSNGSTESFASFTSTSTHKTNPVQAFVGTPRDLSNQIGPGLVFSKWSLASAHLFEDVLSDDFLAVHYGLGPRYQGNFQDSLGGFQTYEASASLGLRNEVIHSGKDESSDILKAIREKASSLLPESKILFSILPTAIFRENGLFQDSQLFRALPRGAANALIHMTHRSGSDVAINTAIPCLADALLRANGAALLTGSPVASIPAYFDDSLWRLAGFTPLALKVLERATTAEETVRAVELIFLCIRKSWRNSEAMERDNGYAVLGMLLRAKLGYASGIGVDAVGGRLLISSEDRDRLSFQLLSLVLDFVGYKHADPLESFIINPLAYRILLIDFDTWRRSATITQELYYKQFVTFSVMSKYHEFNSRRLLRMRIVKRLLDAMKAEPMSEDVVPHFINAFENLVRCNSTAEVYRSLALFVTYAFHSPQTSLPRTPKPMSAVSRSSTPGLVMRRSTTFHDPTGAVGGNSPRLLSKKQLGVKILGMYTGLLCEKGNLTNIRKFARTVTNRWLLYLLGEDDAETVVYGCKILARLLISHGSAYTSKFITKTGGFIVMAQRLKRWWDIPTLWPIVFSILFGYDVAEIDFDRNFEFFSLVETFCRSKIVCPDAMPILTAMLKHGLKDVLRHQEDPNSPAHESGTRTPQPVATEVQTGRPRAKSMDLAKALESRHVAGGDGERIVGNAVVLQTVIRFLQDLHSRSTDFRDFALQSEYVTLLLGALYPVIVSTDPVSPETELNSRDSALTFEGSDVIIRPLAGTAPAPIVRASTVLDPGSPAIGSSRRGSRLRKASSFILITSQTSTQGPSTARLTPAMSPKKKVLSQQSSSVVLDGLLELVINVFEDQVLARKEFPGFNLFLKIPPGFQEHQAYFGSYVLRNTISHLASTIQLKQKILCEPKVLTNMARFNVHIAEAIFEGWFINGAEPTLDFIGMLLEYLQRPDIAAMKSVRLCSQAITTIRNCFLKLTLLRLSEIDDPQTSDDEANAFMNKILYWQSAILGSLTSEDDYMRLLWYQLYTKVIDERESIRLNAVNILRIMLVQKPEESATLLRQGLAVDQQRLTTDFEKLTEVDNETFVAWVDQHRPSLDLLFFGSMSKTWEDFVSVENHRTSDAAKARQTKRKERLKTWHDENVLRESTLFKHEISNSAWMRSIYNTEHFKHQRIMQDQQDDMAFLASSFTKMERDLHRPGAVFSEPTSVKWKLDWTEGRNRMRLRLLPDYTSQPEEYQPKRKANDMGVSGLRVNTAVLTTPSLTTAVIAPSAIEQEPPTNDSQDPDASPTEQGTMGNGDESVAPEEDFELVDDPNDNEGDDGFEDKNRKVMRRLEQGDQVEAVYNVSRIIGLEACEGILIVGKLALYIIDNVFQCASGEIVNVWQAPPEERDEFSQIITDAKTTEARQNRSEQESRSWRWLDVLSISKRRFLFRDVAVELFFTDGRSYLLTAINPLMRDKVFARLMNKAPHTASVVPNSEDAWRLESLRVFDESPQGFGSKLGGIFNSSPWNPALKRWQRGETSNFHYLMLVNTMAGRTFNDLTQYPVFPWVLADYTSEELNLNDPATFRDLSKPMGAQTANRVPGFKESYKALTEIGEIPFHYGTHYSSAMIVSSYLIRLPPFVQSFILLQGGTFDHADRLFQSIPAAWKSASYTNKADVRELIPEFFCLPEFLTNINGYNFGTLQSTGARVDNVLLPPWAKGDPKIFIAKHREALESPYVSQNLHHWIDLVFGYKQRGEAAVENLNVFHHLSYRGAKDLDNIADPQERAITAGVIHNFGQTPHQVFTKPHPSRELLHPHIRRLDTAVYGLARLPLPLLESHERVASLVYAPKLDRLLCASPFRLNVPPYDKFLEWGYADNSIRFYFSDTRKVRSSVPSALDPEVDAKKRKLAGLFENLHIGQISCVVFADSKTLITAGEDCVISVYAVQAAAGKPADLLPRSSLFGHKTPVTTIAISKPFSTFVSVSTDGQALLWDLNRLEFVRKLPFARPVECAAINDVSGEIVLCAGPNVVIFTINGTPILDQNVCAEPDDYVHAVAFYEGSGNEWLENYLVFTGHRRGRVNVWRRVVREGKWALEFMRRLDHVDNRSESGANFDAAITCITPMPQCVYTGDEEGRVYEWNLIQRER